MSINIKKLLLKGMSKLNQEEFYKKVEEKLDVLDKEVLESEINIYREVIKNQKQQGVNEEDIIKAFGSIEEIQRKILKKHGINPDKVLKQKNFFAEKFEELFEVIHRVVEVMSKNALKENVKIILDLLILIVLICLIKIPFILVRNLGDSLIAYLEMPVVSDIWAIIIDLIYIIVAVIVFMNIFTKWFKNLKVNKTQKLKGKELETITLKDEK